MVLISVSRSFQSIREIKFHWDEQWVHTQRFVFCFHSGNNSPQKYVSFESMSMFPFCICFSIHKSPTELLKILHMFLLTSSPLLKLLPLPIILHIALLLPAKAYSCFSSESSTRFSTKDSFCENSQINELMFSKVFMWNLNIIL